MAPITNQAKPFGLKQLKVYRNSVTVALDSARTLTVTPRLTTGELEGNDKLTSVSAKIVAAEFDLEAGGIPLQAYAIMTGTSTTAGIDGNGAYYLTFNEAGGTCYPYFVILGVADLDDCDQQIHIKLPRCKLQSLEGGFEFGEYFVTSATGIALPDPTTGNIREMTQYDRNVTLASS